MDTIVVVLTNARCGVPHLGRFMKRNPEVPVHVVCGKALDGHDRTLAWRNCDRLIREWWLEQGQFLHFKRALFLEWDVVFDARIDEVFPDGHFIGRDVHDPRMKNWQWFSETAALPTELQPHALGVSPLAALMISHECLDAICNHPLSDSLFEQDIFCELRLPTLAASCGYVPAPNREMLPHLGCYPIAAGQGQGVWHSVKV